MIMALVVPISMIIIGVRENVAIAIVVAMVVVMIFIFIVGGIEGGWW